MCCCVLWVQCKWQAIVWITHKSISVCVVSLICDHNRVYSINSFWLYLDQFYWNPNRQKYEQNKMFYRQFSFFSLKDDIWLFFIKCTFVSESTINQMIIKNAFYALFKWKFNLFSKETFILNFLSSIQISCSFCSFIRENLLLYTVFTHKWTNKRFYGCVQREYTHTHPYIGNRINETHVIWTSSLSDQLSTFWHRKTNFFNSFIAKLVVLNKCETAYTLSDFIRQKTFVKVTSESFSKQTLDFLCNNHNLTVCGMLNKTI